MTVEAALPLAHAGSLGGALGDALAGGAVGATVWALAQASVAIWQALRGLRRRRPGRPPAAKRG